MEFCDQDISKNITIRSFNLGQLIEDNVYSYFMPVCSILKTITPKCCGRPDALLHEAECNSASGCPQYRGVIV